MDGDDFEVAYGYDANGNLASLTYPDGRVVTYTIDAHDRAEAVSQELNGYVSDVVTQATHLPNGPVDLVDFPGAVPSWDPEYGVRYQMETLMVRTIHSGIGTRWAWIIVRTGRDASSRPL